MQLLNKDVCVNYCLGHPCKEEGKCADSDAFAVHLLVLISWSFISLVIHLFDF